jgi:hypothetical protein
MDPELPALVTQNLRLRDLVAVVNENRAFFEDFERFMNERGYESILAFIQEDSDAAAVAVISAYLGRDPQATLYDGFLRPYAGSRAKWYFLAWLFRDAATQRLQPLLGSFAGGSPMERKANLLNELRKDAAQLFPRPGSWTWDAVSEVMLARLEGSRRALRGTLMEEIVRRNLRRLIEANGLPIQVLPTQVRIADETYDVQVNGLTASLLLPVKSRETMGGGHAYLFTRDIYKSISVAQQAGLRCIPIVIAESWTADLNELKSESHIYVQANPNQIALVEREIARQLRNILPVLRELS